MRNLCPIGRRQSGRGCTGPSGWGAHCAGNHEQHQTNEGAFPPGKAGLRRRQCLLPTGATSLASDGSDTLIINYFWPLLKRSRFALFLFIAKLREGTVLVFAYPCQNGCKIREPRRVNQPLLHIRRADGPFPRRQALFRAECSWPWLLLVGSA